MNRYSLHILSIILYALMIVSICFLTMNPLVLLSILICELVVFLYFNKKELIISTVKVFLPLLAITVFINLLFVNAGVVVLFNVFNKYITLENLIYSVLFAVKLLIIIYLFYIFEIYIDSDAALSFFSSKMPKTTLLFMVCFKLIPTMKKKLKDLRDIYQVRGVEFNSKSRFQRIKAQIPLIIVLIEESLEASFDISESAYIRGFLSGKRTVFNKSKFKHIDYLVSIISIISIFYFLIVKKVTDYNVYDDYKLTLNPFTFSVCVLVFVLSFVINYYYKENVYAN
ncbi:MAG: putative cobalt transport protein permease component [Caloramator sp.]|uniref:energy-coupling factor transporter transmembrane component T n=1 Tax=Caloramator sp. TaxID=1871330 RepID=UPI001DA0883C|nr:energy-coupling factor transporter transmembrane component T [Caloramator sp.]MBZ4664480.1 putative cobalt transport protein permease component [Caloramator sp.]